jgi:hypothetical protein
VGAAEFTEWVHPIGTQREPDVPRLVTKLLEELSVEMLRLLAIGGMSQLAIALHTLIRCMPRHQLGILGVPKYSTQVIDNGQISHRWGQNFPLRVLTVTNDEIRPSISS